MIKRHATLTFQIYEQKSRPDRAAQIADKVPTKLSFSTGALCFYGAC